MLLVQYTYPFDPNGTATTNKVVGERHTITPVNGPDFRFLIPRAAPYFKTSMQLLHVASNTPLLEGIHWAAGHKFDRASNTAPFLAVYGSILILDNTIEGVIELTQYQTLGGEFTINETLALELLANAQLDPRLAKWDNVLNTPTTYDPLLHRHHASESTGYEDMVGTLNRLADAIIAGLGQSVVDPLARSHISNMNNPHNTRQSQVIDGEHLANLTPAHVATIINAINGGGGLGGGGSTPTLVGPGAIPSRNRIVFNNTVPNSEFALNPTPANFEWVEWVSGPIPFSTHPVIITSNVSIEGSTDGLLVNGDGDCGLLIYFAGVNRWKLYRSAVGAGSGGLGDPADTSSTGTLIPKQAATQLMAGDYFVPVNTAGPAFHDAPTTPSDLATVEWIEGAVSFAVNKLVIRNTDKPIMGLNEPLEITTAGAGGKMIYFAALGYWKVYLTNQAGTI